VSRKTNYRSTVRIDGRRIVRDHANAASVREETASRLASLGDSDVVDVEIKKHGELLLSMCGSVTLVKRWLKEWT